MAPIPDGRPVWESDARLTQPRRQPLSGGRRPAPLARAGRGLRPGHAAGARHGAATHSWARLLPPLAARFTVVAPDLPGHGFTDMPPPRRMSRPAWATAWARCWRLWTSADAGGRHSAGAAILCRMALDRVLAPGPDRGHQRRAAAAPAAWRATCSALGAARRRTSLLPRLFSWHARVDGHMVRRLICDTGSRIGGVELEMYQWLAQRPGHAAAALAMMAHWDLEALRRTCRDCRSPWRCSSACGIGRWHRPRHAAFVRSCRRRALWSFPASAMSRTRKTPATVAEAILGLAANSVRQD